MKKIQLLLFVFAAFILLSCHHSSYTFLEGETMGTIYHIKYYSPGGENLGKTVDDLLLAVNNSLSTYLPNSTISKFNNADSVATTDSFFNIVFNKSKEIYELSKGAFDPTVMPLVNAWGFGFDTLPLVDSMIIDSLLQYVGFDKVSLVNNQVYKTMPGVMLDFSAIAKGFGVDVISEYLESKNIENFMVEIGGEVRVKGHNPENNNWQVGIEKPEEGIRELHAVAGVNHTSMATSGNYRNFYYKDGKRFAHTIDPFSGYPVQHSVLSATVFAPDCMTADAFATAVMVMGLEKAIQLDKSLEKINMYLIFENGNNELDTYVSPETEPLIRSSSD